MSGRVLGLARPQVRLLFGLSLAQAAATLAAVTIGVEIGLFDTDLLNATLVVVLVTVLASSLLTRSAARRIEPPPLQGERLAENVFVPIDVSTTRRSFGLPRASRWPRVGTCWSVRLRRRREISSTPPEPALGRQSRQASALGAEASSVVRVDTSAASALAAIVAEHEVTLVVTGWRKAALAADVVFGGQDADLRGARRRTRPRGADGARRLSDASSSRSTSG